MNKNFFSILLLGMFISNGALAADNQLLDASNPNKILEVVKENYKDVVLLPADKKDGPIIVANRNSDRQFYIAFLDCDQNNANCKEIYFIKQWKDMPISLEKANKFNDKLIPVSLTSGDVPITKMSLILTKGVTKEYLDSIFTYWSAHLITFPILISKI